MAKRVYYQQRLSRSSGESALPLDVVARLVANVFRAMSNTGYFAEVFGVHCVDAGLMPGLAGEEIGLFIFQKTRLPDLWPLDQELATCGESKLFTAIEFLYDFVSKPTGGDYHSWSNCGYHWDAFERAPGQAKWREEINDILEDYGEGFELQENGEIRTLGPTGLREYSKPHSPLGRRATRLPSESRQRRPSSAVGYQAGRTGGTQSVNSPMFLRYFDLRPRHTS